MIPGMSYEKTNREKRLTNVLKALAIRFPELGYVQGMGMIAQFPLAYMEEEDAFWFLVYAFEVHNFRSYYMCGFPGLKKEFYIHLCLTRDYLPKLFDHFVFSKSILE